MLLDQNTLELPYHCKQVVQGLLWVSISITFTKKNLFSKERLKKNRIMDTHIKEIM